MLTIFLSIFLSKGCAQDQELSDVKVVYGANTRGYHRMITIENGTFSLVSQRDGKPSVVNLTDAQWKKLAELYSKIDLKTFNDLEGPTMERAYDGKPHADMTIVVKDKTYTTKGFDHTIPPAKIKEFVDYINKIADDSVFKPITQLSISFQPISEITLAFALKIWSAHINSNSVSWLIHGFPGQSFFSWDCHHVMY